MPKYYSSGVHGFIYRQLFDQVPQYDSGVDLTGKTILITGCNTGLGFEAAKHLLEFNANLILVTRSREKGEDTRDRLMQDPKINRQRISLMECDMGNTTSVLSLAMQVEREAPLLDVIILNAGVAKTSWEALEEGYEMHYQVNFISTALLALALLPTLRKAEGSRLVFTSSEGHAWSSLQAQPGMMDEMKCKISCSGNAMYCDSKQMLQAWAGALATHEKKVRVVTLTPGYCATDLLRGHSKWLATILNNLLAYSAEEGARSIVIPAYRSEVKTGEYWVIGVPREPAIFDQKMPEAIWTQFLEFAEKLNPGISSGIVN